MIIRIILMGFGILIILDSAVNGSDSLLGLFGFFIGGILIGYAM